MNIILLHETLHEGLLQATEVHCDELEDLGRLLARDEECCFGVFMDLRLALVHCPLCTGIFGFSVQNISIDIQYIV